MPTLDAKASAATVLSARQRQLGMAALMSAALLSSLDLTIANTALPQIARNLSSSEAQIIWVANAYQIAMISMLLPFASLGESIGYRKIYVTGLIVFACASAVCGFASDLAVLVSGRALQGIGAAAMMSVISAFIRHIYPPDMLGRGIGLNALLVAIGFTLGPVVASAILSLTTWHWLFFINIPVAVASIVLSVCFLPDAIGGKHRFDRASALLCTAFLGLLTYGFCAMENGGHAAVAAASVVCAAVCLVMLLTAQRGHPAPMLAVDLMRIRVIRLSSLTSICAFTTQSLALVALPFLLQVSLGISVVSTGWVLSAWPAFVAVMAIIVGPLSDRGRFSSGALCSTGLLILTAGMCALAAMPHSTTGPGVAVRLAVCGVGFGFFQAPNMREIISNAPASRAGGASAVVAISRLLGQTCGAALVAQCFHWWQTSGPVAALWIGGLFAFLGCVFSAMRLAPRNDVVS